MAAQFQMDEELVLASLVTVEEDLQPYVLRWPSASETDGEVESLALVVAKR